MSKSDEKVLQEVSVLQKVRNTMRSKWRHPTRCEQVNEWKNLIFRWSFVSRRLCMEFALRAKHDEQNVKVRSRGAIGALWWRTEAEGRSNVQIADDRGGGEVRIGRMMEAPLRSKLPFIFEALTCIPWYLPALKYPCSWPEGYSLPFPGHRLIFKYFFWLKFSNSQDESTTFPGHFMVHQLIAGGLKLQSDRHPMVGNLSWPWRLHRLIMN